MNSDVEEFLEHFGVKGMKWGIRRNPQSGIRPIANTLNKSKFGRLAKANVDRHNRAKTRRKTSGTSTLGSVGRVGAGAAISAGTIFAVQWLLTKGPSKVSQLVVPDAEHVFYGRGDKWVAKRK